MDVALFRMNRVLPVFILALILVITAACDISQQQLSKLPEAARTALLHYVGDDLQVRILGVGEFTIPDGMLPSGEQPDEVWCVVYKWTTSPGEPIETEGVLLVRQGDKWSVSAWVNFIDNCAISYWGSPYWSQR